jgi:hypothetical protein
VTPPSSRFLRRSDLVLSASRDPGARGGDALRRHIVVGSMWRTSSHLLLMCYGILNGTNVCKSTRECK